MKSKLFCRVSGHAWSYYRRESGEYLRVCDRCHRMQEWIAFFGSTRKTWVGVEKYTKLGAELEVPGFGQEGL